jgi:hypothetical protein
LLEGKILPSDFISMTEKELACDKTKKEMDEK